MKTIIKTALIYTIASILIVGCSIKIEDPCLKLQCGTHGTCNFEDTACDCNTGWEGAKCETETRARFFGNYTVAENCGGTMQNYSCIISGGMGALDITLNPIKGVTLNGTVESNNTINIQSVATGTYSQVSGTGVLSGNTINLNLTFTPGIGSSFNCSFTLTK